MAQTALYCVIYRVGGRDRFEWKRTLGMTQAEAIKAANETMRMGYPVLIEKCKRVDALGLPETFDVRDAVTI